MIETIALILFLAVILAMIVAPENKAQIVRTESVQAAPAKTPIAQTA